MSEAKKPDGIVRRHFEVGETAVTILAEERFVPLATESIFRSRSIIQGFIAQDPLFKDTLEPYDQPESADPLIERMCDASRIAGVGPMASVAGVIAEAAVRSMVEAGARQAAVDNGGDISMYLSEPLEVGIFAGESPIKDLGLRFPAEERYYSVCTSSGTVGPSISFGISDAAVVLAEDAALADACATRLGNEVQSSDEEGMLHALGVIMDVEGVDGALVIVGDRMAMKGRLPPLVRTKVSMRSISRSEL
ncbi:MAG TPA: UPF0280 family protein [Methanomassiliicoccales archaeon]|nr:UPF0280 family protein [Methanomassiliicoccales archaeon]